jgi:transposase-like protein
MAAAPRCSKVHTGKLLLIPHGTVPPPLSRNLLVRVKHASEQEALSELDNFATTWDEKYPQISKSWRAHWPNLIRYFNYPPDIRKVTYTTNAIEPLNSVIRKSVKTRKLFPSDEPAMNHFMIELEKQLAPYV